MTVTADSTALILKKIKEIPPLPTAVQKLLKAMGDDHSNAETLAGILNSDQALAAKVLKLVNSSFYGMSGQVSTVSRAVVILGHSAINNLAVGLGVAKVLFPSDPDGNQAAFRTHAIATAAAAEILARHTGYPDPEEAFITGLLSDIGHPVLWLALPEEFARVFAMGPESLTENEERHLGMSHAKAGQVLLKQWNLPRAISRAVRFHHHRDVVTAGSDTLASLVALADVLASVHGAPYVRGLDDEAFLALASMAGLDGSHIGDFLTALTCRIEEARLFLETATEGDLQPGPRSVPAGLRIALVSPDPERTAWAEGILRHFGHDVDVVAALPAEGPSGITADLVLLDQAGLTAEGFPAPDAGPDARVLILGTGDPGPGRPDGPRRMPLAFSRSDLVID